MGTRPLPLRGPCHGDLTLSVNYKGIRVWTPGFKLIVWVVMGCIKLSRIANESVSLLKRGVLNLLSRTVTRNFLCNRFVCTEPFCFPLDLPVNVDLKLLVFVFRHINVKFYRVGVINEINRIHEYAFVLPPKSDESVHVHCGVA